MRNPRLSLDPTVACPTGNHRLGNDPVESRDNLQLLAILAVLVTLLTALLTATLDGPALLHADKRPSSPRPAATSAADAVHDERSLFVRSRPLDTDRAHHLAAESGSAGWLVNLTNHQSANRVLSGTGIVVRSHGVILTNAHVVDHARHLTAITYGGAGTSHRATILWIDRAHDLALIKVYAGRRLRTAPLGNSDSLRPGDQVGSIGNAWGLNETWIAAGPVTRLHRSIPSTTETHHRLSDLIEIRNWMSPGQSGGPLVTSSGRVVGINVAYSHAGTAAPTGTGYAIPINDAVRILADRARRSVSTLS